MDLEDEETWLHHHVMRLRMVLRYTRARQAETILKESIANAESRLEAVIEARQKHPEQK